MPARKLLILLGIVLCFTALFIFIFHIPFALPAEDAATPYTHSTELGLLLLDQEDGLYLLAVTEGSVAQRAGFLPGDLLLKSGSERLTSVTELDALIAGDDDVLRITLLRNNQEMNLKLPISKGLAKPQRNQYTNLVNGGDQH